VKKSKLTLLGKSGVSVPGRLLESFEKPKKVVEITMTSDEVTAVCPVTGQPDQYTVTIRYLPKDKCIESKALKLKLQSYRNTGVFCEKLASEILLHVMESIAPYMAEVTVVQKPRGGVKIEATAWSKG
jgi:7-cyano-7-deazaguanine reductase